MRRVVVDPPHDVQHVVHYRRRRALTSRSGHVGDTLPARGFVLGIEHESEPGKTAALAAECIGMGRENIPGMAREPSSGHYLSAQHPYGGILNSHGIIGSQPPLDF